MKSDDEKDPTVSLSSVGYSKTRLLGLFALFDIDRFDTAIVLAAIEKVDSKFTQKVDVRAFVDIYVKEWGWVFILIWENYYELLHDLKEPLVAADIIKEQEQGDSDQEEGKDEEIEKKEKDETERRKVLLEDRHRPEYFVFLGFLFFIISIRDRVELSPYQY